MVWAKIDWICMEICPTENVWMIFIISDLGFQLLFNCLPKKIENMKFRLHAIYGSDVALSRRCTTCRKQIVLLAFTSITFDRHLLQLASSWNAKKKSRLKMEKITVRVWLVWQIANWKPLIDAICRMSELLCWRKRRTKCMLLRAPIRQSTCDRFIVVRRLTTTLHCSGIGMSWLS